MKYVYAVIAVVMTVCFPPFAHWVAVDHGGPWYCSLAIAYGLLWLFCSCVSLSMFGDKEDSNEH